MPSLTREEAELLMRENLERLEALLDRKLDDFRNRLPDTNVAFQELQRNYKVYNATVLPVLPRGTMILLDLRSATNATGTVAKYSSLGDRWVEEWAKTVNP